MTSEPAHNFDRLTIRPAEAEGLEVVAWRWRLRDKSRWAFAETAPHSLIGVPDIDCDALALKSAAAARITALQADVGRLTDPGYLAEKLRQVGVVDAEWRTRATTAESSLASARQQIDALREAAPCPRPASGRPDDETAATCIGAGLCGCMYGDAKP